MGWTHKHRRLRQQMRKKFTEETGSTDYTSRKFAAWVEKQLAE